MLARDNIQVLPRAARLDNQLIRRTVEDCATSPIDMRSEMILAPPLWTFTDLVDRRRCELMMAVPNWAAVRRVVESHLPTWAGLETRDDRLGVGGVGSQRAKVEIAMPADDADLVYNSPVGLRAQYCLGSGPRFNRELINALIPACLTRIPRAERRLAEQSFRGIAAKLCLDSADIPNLEEVHIHYPPWIACLGRGERLAETGVLAPRVETIWIKGAWLLDGREWQDPLKTDRDEKFRLYGFG